MMIYPHPIMLLGGPFFVVGYYWLWVWTAK